MTAISWLRTLDLETDPHYGYDEVETYGEPFDAFIATLDADSGGTCQQCEASVGSSLHDDFTDDGHRFRAGWTWMTLVANEAGAVWVLCESCSTALAPKPVSPKAPHDCGLCDEPLRFDGRQTMSVDGQTENYATFVCTSAACDWWHIAKDCCHEQTR